MPGSAIAGASNGGEDIHRDRAAILKQLEKVIGSSLFARAGRMQRLLSFLVLETLEGRSDRLKEYTIAVEVFDRPPDFNPATNPVVRVEVGRLRRLLAQYQLEVGTGDEFVITIPKGSYVSEFHRSSATEPAPGQKGQAWEAEPAPNAPQGLPQTIRDPERRQVTVMACGLECNPGRDVGAELDPERYHEVFNVFLDSVTRISRHYGGTVEGQASDRLLVFFGWPEALENAAGRALTAALEIASFFRGVPEQEKFGVRAAIITGPVIIQPVSDSGRAPSVVGEATALAGRILPQVPLNGVLVAEPSRRIAGNAFEFVSAGMLDAREGDGLLLWRLIGVRSTTSRFSVSSPNVQVPIVGRREELALLLRRWHFTQKREGQTVIIVGEPGIGKSKLVHAVLDKVADTSVQICMQCSPYHLDSPLHPISACITASHGGLLKFMYPDEVEEITSYIKGEEHAGAESRYSTPVGRRDYVFGLLASILMRVSELQPCIVLIEDAHWADPTTLQFIRHLSAISKIERIMVVVTARSVETGSVSPRSTDATVLNLSRLPQSYCLSIIDRLSTSAPLSAWKRNIILDKADGIPLYIEELTKSLLAPDSQRPVLIPETLLDLLMAQLDRLGPARTVAQVAAVIGREFNKELLTAILHQPESTIEATLDQLRAADVIVAHGAGQSQSLAFRHALLRDAAYESLVLRTRRHWHARVAETYQQRFPEVTTSQPELVARHWTDAGHSDAALPLWFDAGRKAANRFANAEAISHFHAGLDLLREQADTDDRRRQELAFLTELGLVLRVSRGYGHPELEQIYRRASELCSDLGDVEALAKNIFGLWTFAAAHADWRETDALVEKFTALSKSQSDDQLHVERWRLQGVSAVFQGRFEAAATALKTSFSHYDPARHGPRFGFDPGPTVLIYLSWAAFHLGNTAEAEAYAARAVALAEEKGHAPTMALVMTWQILYLAAKKNWTSVKQVSSSLDKLCTEKGFPQWRPLGSAFGLFADFLENKDPAAIDGMLAAAEAFRGYWGGFLIPCFWITAAEACWIAGMFDRGHELLDAAEAFQSAHGEYLWKDELKRVQGLFRTEEPALKVTLPRSGGAKSLPGLSPPADQSKA